MFHCYPNGVLRVNRTASFEKTGCRSPSDSAAAGPADLGTRRETNDQNDPKMRVATEPNRQIDQQDWLCEMEMEETKKVDDSRMYVT